MTENPEPTISVRVDPANPGQFFACCGLLELADRLWRGAEGWFDDGDSRFSITTGDLSCSCDKLVHAFVDAGISSNLSPSLRTELRELETKRRELKKARKELTKADEQRRTNLGKLAREGPIAIGQPFCITLDWWLNRKENGFFSALGLSQAYPARPNKDQNPEDAAIPKTWAGSQQVLRIARAAFFEIPRAFKNNQPFDFDCVMRPAPTPPEEEDATGKNGKKKSGVKDKVEPFYFDSRHAANALPLDIGFSPNELGMESKAFPAVELLCLIGLQRCLPRLTNVPLTFEYFTWSMPLPTAALSAAVNGLLAQRIGYRFENAYRTDQRKHSCFRSATPFRR